MAWRRVWRTSIVMLYLLIKLKHDAASEKGYNSWIVTLWVKDKYAYSS